MTEDATYRRELYEVRSAPDLSVDEKIDRYLEIGCAYLDVENGHVKRVDQERSEHYVLASAGEAIEATLSLCISHSLPDTVYLV